MNRQRLVRIVILALLAIGITFAIDQREHFDPAALEVWIKGFGILAPILFVALYATATIFFFPGSVLTLAGGALFGPVWGSLYNLVGATIGATIAFVIARYLAGDWVAKKSGGKLKPLMDGVESEGWRFVAFVRLVPIFPFNLLNYALGLTRIPLGHYVLATLVCMAPGGIAYTYLGYAGREAVSGGDGLIQTIIIAIALLGVVMFLPRWVQKARNGAMTSTEELQQLLQLDDAAQRPLLLDVRGDEQIEEPGAMAIPGALHLPSDEIVPRIHRLDGHRNQPIVIVATGESDGVKAAKLLRKLGFERVSTLRGGITGVPTVATS